MQRESYLRHGAEWNKAYYWRDPEKHRASARARHLENSAKANARRRLLYRVRDEAKLTRERRASNPEKHRAALREYRKNNPEKCRTRDKVKHAQRRGASGKFTVADVRQKFANQNGECFWCHEDISGKFHVDHVMPISRGGTNDPSNLVLACPKCNMHKHNKLPEDWMRMLAA